MKRTRRLAVVSALAALTVLAVAGNSSAGPVLTARSLACGGSGPQRGSITVSERAGLLTIKVQASGLVPGQAVTCGYTCGMVFTGGPQVACGTVAANGRFSARIEQPLGTCFGFIPFFSTPSTGKCVASAVP